MKRWLPIVAAATLIGLVPHPHAIADGNSAFQEAKVAFDAARAGKAKAEDAVALFSELLEHDPGNPLIAAYRASAVVMQARDAWLPWNKMKYLDDGLADMDRALQMLKPQHEQVAASGISVAMMVRLVSANAFVAVPSFANRGGEGRRLIRTLVTRDDFAGAPASFRISALELAISSATEPNADLAGWQRQLSELKQTATVASGVAQ